MSSSKMGQVARKLSIVVAWEGPNELKVRAVYYQMICCKTVQHHLLQKRCDRKNLSAVISETNWC
jgi:hypothetical protein